MNPDTNNGQQNKNVAPTLQNNPVIQQEIPEQSKAQKVLQETVQVAAAAGVIISLISTIKNFFNQK